MHLYPLADCAKLEAIGSFADYRILKNNLNFN